MSDHGPQKQPSSAAKIEAERRYAEDLRKAYDPACPACGMLYREHLGLIGTCAQLEKTRHDLIAARHNIVELECAIARLEKQQETFMKRILEGVVTIATHDVLLGSPLEHIPGASLYAHMRDVAFDMGATDEHLVEVQKAWANR